MSDTSKTGVVLSTLCSKIGWLSTQNVCHSLRTRMRCVNFIGQGNVFKIRASESKVEFKIRKQLRLDISRQWFPQMTFCDTSSDKRSLTLGCALFRKCFSKMGYEEEVCQSLITKFSSHGFSEHSREISNNPTFYWSISCETRQAELLSCEGFFTKKGKTPHTQLLRNLCFDIVRSASIHANRNEPQ